MADSFEQISAEIGLAVSRILRADLALLAGYSQAKAQAIARFTLALGEGYAAGTIDEAGLRREKQELERMVVRFVRNIQALATVTVERLIAGIAEVLSAALRRLTGIADLALAPTPATIWGVGPV
jgi:hypothetical protein